MGKERILYINTFSWGTAHEMFNATLFDICAGLDRPIICRAVKSNYQRMCKSANVDNWGKNVKYKRVITIGGEGRFNLLFRYIWGAILCWIYLLFSYKNDLIVLPFNNLFAIGGVNYINKRLKRKIIVFCHGEMEFIASNANRKGLLSVMLSNRCLTFFKSSKIKLSNELYFAVLGDIIMKNLKPLLAPNIYNHFISFDHPYYFTPVKGKMVTNNNLLLGSCGAMSTSKGAHEMAYFSQLCSKYDFEVEIFHIGKVWGVLEELQSSGVMIPSANSELSRQYYNELIAELDYILFFYPSTNYKITASGAIMDAIAMRKPIIALRNDYFEYIFKKFGTFGYLVDSVEQMVKVVCTLQNVERRDYFDFEAIQQRFTPKALRYEFQDVINRIEAQ